MCQLCVILLFKAMDKAGIHWAGAPAAWVLALFADFCLVLLTVLCLTHK